MNSVCRDSQRRQIYVAEDLSAEHTVLTAAQSIEYLQEVVDQLLVSRWWADNFSSDRVAVLPNRSGQRSFYADDLRIISLSPRSTDLSTLCHELAHRAAFGNGHDGAVHGARFRSLHVLVRCAVLGDVCADDLRQVYGQFALSVPRLNDVCGAPASPILDRSLYERTTVVGRPAVAQTSAWTKGPIAL